MLLHRFLIASSHSWDESGTIQLFDAFLFCWPIRSRLSLIVCTCYECIGLIVCCDSRLWGLYWQIDDIWNNEYSFSLLLVNRTLYSLRRALRNLMTSLRVLRSVHDWPFWQLRWRGDRLYWSTYWLDAFKSDAICFFVGDLPLYVFFLHGYVSKLLIYLLRGIVRGKLIIFFLLFYWVRLLNKS